MQLAKTNIDLCHDAKLHSGTELVAFGTGTFTGVIYVVASLDPTAGTSVPDIAHYSNKGFAVGGKPVFLVGSHMGSLPYQVSVYNATPCTVTQTFTTDNNRIKIINIGQSYPDRMEAVSAGPTQVPRAPAGLARRLRKVARATWPTKVARARKQR